MICTYIMSAAEGIKPNAMRIRVQRPAADKSVSARKAFFVVVSR